MEGEAQEALEAGPQDSWRGRGRLGRRGWRCTHTGHLAALKKPAVVGRRTRSVAVLSLAQEAGKKQRRILGSGGGPGNYWVPVGQFREGGLKKTKKEGAAAPRRDPSSGGRALRAGWEEAGPGRPREALRTPRGTLGGSPGAAAAPAPPAGPQEFAPVTSPGALLSPRRPAREHRPDCPCSAGQVKPQPRDRYWARCGYGTLAASPP